MTHPHALATSRRLFGTLDTMISSFNESPLPNSVVCLPPCFIEQKKTPTKRYKPISNPEGTCPICLSKFTSKDKDVVCLRDICLHSFHKACIHRWIEKKHKCPLCQKNVL